MHEILREYKAKYKGNAMAFGANCKINYKANARDF